ncbi:hypothetical protein NDU88_003004 [Pleurodeles waltl]|uniref:Uncharacterized protein n=1 Tax=Pleurodeles waltl TaxID=8319 RepID=A0AAV7RH12_PLEWA|nr:hypothetical protein NDU88_003004 [Pleurodeles waltl]
MLASLPVLIPCAPTILAIGGLCQSPMSVELALLCRRLLLYSWSLRLCKSIFLLFFFHCIPSVHASPVLHLGTRESSLVFQMISSDVPGVNRGRPSAVASRLRHDLLYFKSVRGVSGGFQALPLLRQVARSDIPPDSLAAMGPLSMERDRFRTSGRQLPVFRQAPRSSGRSAPSVQQVPQLATGIHHQAAPGPDPAGAAPSKQARPGPLQRWAKIDATRPAAPQQGPLAPRCAKGRLPKPPRQRRRASAPQGSNQPAPTKGDQLLQATEAQYLRAAAQSSDAVASPPQPQEPPGCRLQEFTGSRGPS